MTSALTPEVQDIYDPVLSNSLSPEFQLVVSTALPFVPSGMDQQIHVVLSFHLTKDDGYWSARRAEIRHLATSQIQVDSPIPSGGRTQARQVATDAAIHADDGYWQTFVARPKQNFVTQSVIVVPPIPINRTQMMASIQEMILKKDVGFWEASAAMLLRRPVHLPRSFYTTLSEALTLSDSVLQDNHLFPTEVLSLSDSWVVDSSKHFAEGVSLADSFIVGVDLKRTLTETLTLGFTIYAELVKGTHHGNQSTCLETYDVPGLSTASVFVLTYPYVSPTSTLTLRVPKFGNTHVTHDYIVNRRTRGGQLLVGKGPNWPVIQTFKYSFHALTATQVADFLQFCRDSAGQEIGLLDQEDRLWRGVILSPDVHEMQVGIGCQFECEFDFRGRLA